MTYIDEKGYLRDFYGKLVHRQIAYQKMYEGNENKFKDYFKELHVHHIDGDKQNNKVSNLFICSNEDHDRIHREQKRKQKRFQNKRELLKLFKKPEKKEKHKEHICEDCGREINHRGCCLPCNVQRKEYRERKFEEMRSNQKMIKRVRTEEKSYDILVGGIIGFLIGLFYFEWIFIFIIIGMGIGYLCKLKNRNF